MSNRSPSIASSGASVARAEAEHLSPVAVPLPQVLAKPAALDWLIAQRADLGAASFLLMLTALVAWQRLWLWNGLAHLDIATFYLPWYAFMGEHLRQLQLPGWNPHQFSGTPFAADPQSGWMYLPAMIAFTFLPAIAAYQWFLVFHLVLAGLSAYAFARVMGLSVIPSLVVGVGFEFGPLVNHISCCLIHVQLAAWIPISLIGVEMGLRAKRRSSIAGWWCLTGFAISQMLAGWMGQGAYNGLLVVGSFLAYRALLSALPHADWRGRFRRFIVDGAAVVGIGIAIGAAGVLPRLDEVRSTNVAGGSYTGFEVNKYANGWKTTSLLDFMMTANNGWRSYLFYLGGATLALAIMAPFVARRRYAAPYFLGLTLVVSMLTLNRGPVLDLFFLLPRYEVLHQHVPSRVLAVQWLGPSMLAGATVEALLRDRHRRWVYRAAFAPLLAYGIVLPIVRADGVNGASLSTVLVVAATCLVVAGFVVVPLRNRRWASSHWQPLKTGLAVLLLLLVVWDPTGRVFLDAVRGGENPVLALPTGPVSRQAIEVNASQTDLNGAGEFIRQATTDGDRVRYFGYDDAFTDGGWNWPSTYREFYWNGTVQDLLVNARAMRLGLDDVQGYNPVQLSRYVAMLNVLNQQNQNYHDAQILRTGLDSPLLDILNARYIVIPNDLPPGRPRPDLLALIRTHPEVYRNASVRVLENPDALPRAWMVHETRRTTEDGALWLIGSGTANPRTTVVLPLNSRLPSLQPATTGASEDVSITRYEPDTMTMRVDAASDGILVVSETYDRGWNAYVDGKKTPVLLANGVQRAVAVPSGQHTVELRYQPRSLFVGIVISSLAGVAVLIVAGWAGIAALRRRRAGGVDIRSRL